MYAILLVVCYVYTNHACERNGNVVDRGNLEWACIDKKKVELVVVELAQNDRLEF